MIEVKRTNGLVPTRVIEANAARIEKLPGPPALPNSQVQAMNFSPKFGRVVAANILAGRPAIR